MPCLCTQVSHQAQGHGFKSQGMITKHLVCEGHPWLVAVEIHTRTMGRQKA